MPVVNKYLKSWHIDKEILSIVLLYDGTKCVEWICFDGGMKFEEYLKLETAAQEMEEYYKEPDKAALIREYQAQGEV